MKTQTAEEIKNALFDLIVLQKPLENTEKKINKAMHDHTTTQIEALRERLKEMFADRFAKHIIDSTINEFLKEINP